jgi:hypothetical protein
VNALTLHCPHYAECVAAGHGSVEDDDNYSVAAEIRTVKERQMAITGKMRYCWNCGAEMGLIGDAYYDRSDTCGRRECERAAQEQAQAEREEAHERLDRDLGY